MNNKENANDVTNNVVIINDSIGRLIIGELVNQTNESIQIRCPQVVSMGQNPNDPSKASLQFLPYCWIELLNDGGASYIWTFSKSSISYNNNTVSERAVKIYYAIVESLRQRATQMINEQNDKPENTNTEPKIVKLFEDQ